jgi:hypothetical protein
MPSLPYRSCASVSLLVVGSVLLSIDIAGLVLEPPSGEPSLVPKAQQVPGYHYSVGSNGELLRRLSKPEKEFSLEASNDLVARTIRHVEDRRLAIYENPLMWMAGKLYDPMSRTQNPHKVAKGAQGLCSEAALVLTAIAKLHGVPARLVGLSGHVVSEIQTPQGWRVADPDFGITFPATVRELEGPAGPPMIEQALRGKGYDDAAVKYYVDVFQTSNDNVVAPIHAPLSPRLAKVEAWAEWLNWIVPIALLTVGALCLRKPRCFRQEQHVSGGEQRTS